MPQSPAEDAVQDDFIGLIATSVLIGQGLNGGSITDPQPYLLDR
jgi:hypothetical protein